MAYSIKSLGFGKVAVVHNDKHIKTFHGMDAPQQARQFINNQYKSSQPGTTAGKIPTHEAAADIYLNIQLDEQINEVLSKDASAGEWIKDFIESDNPKFAGKSKADRKKMALAAYYAKQRNESVGELDKPPKTIEVTRKNGNKFTGTIKLTGDDYHIVKDKSGKQYTVDHSGNTIDEATELGNESEFKVTKAGQRWKKAANQEKTGKPEKSLEYADKETNIKEGTDYDSVKPKVKHEAGVTVISHGAHFHVVLHPEHQETIKKLEDDQKHSFKDEQGYRWTAHRRGDTVHFVDSKGADKTHAPLSSISAEKLKENLSFANLFFDGEVIIEDVQIDLQEGKYEDYFKAMMKKAGINAISDLKSDEEKKEFMNSVDAGYKAKNESIIAEEYMRSDIEKKIESHEKMGHKVAEVKHSIRDGKPYSEFIVTTPEGNKKKYIFHGNAQRHEKLA